MTEWDEIRLRWVAEKERAERVLVMTDQEIDEHIRATEHLPFSKTSDERRVAFRANRDALVHVSHDDHEGEAHVD